MRAAFWVGVDDGIDTAEMTAELERAQRERFELMANYQATLAPELLESSWQRAGIERLDPRFAPLTPPLAPLTPGAVSWFPAAPYDYQSFVPGPVLCWASSSPQFVDAQSGRIRLRACSDPAAPRTDNAYGQLGTLLTVEAGQQADVFFSWVAGVRFQWSLPDPQDWVNLTAVVQGQVWSWNPLPAPGSKVKQMSFVPGFSHTWAPVGGTSGLQGAQRESLVPAGHSGVLTRLVIDPQPVRTTYCALLSTHLQVNSGGGAIELDLSLTQPA